MESAHVHFLALNEVVGVLSVSRSNRGLHRGFGRARENAVKRIVVGSGNRIELVIVATRAGHRQSEERFRRDVNPIVDESLASGR